MKNEQDNVINQLRKLSSFVQSKNFKTPEEMTKILKDTTDPMVTYKALLKFTKITLSRPCRGLLHLQITKGDILK